VYVRRDLIRELSPSVTGWMAFEGTDDFARLTQYNDTLRGDARRFELITLPYQDFVGMNASLGLILELGVGRIAGHLRRLHAPVVAWAERSGARLTSPQGSHGSGILCVAPANVGEAFRALKAARIICSMREGAIRLSPHAYNTSGEMERVASLLEHSNQ
jgi:selenocysteine lyase/cysteine desulfurase